MKRIYVAGAYSADNVLSIFDNIRRGIELGTRVFLAGYAPFVPFLDFHFRLHDQKMESSVQNFYDYSMAFLDVCDAVLVASHSENSIGVKKEIARAEELGIPVFYDFDEMHAYFVGQESFRY